MRFLSDFVFDIDPHCLPHIEKLVEVIYQHEVSWLPATKQELAEHLQNPPAITVYEWNRQVGLFAPLINSNKLNYYSHEAGWIYHLMLLRLFGMHRHLQWSDLPSHDNEKVWIYKILFLGDVDTVFLTLCSEPMYICVADKTETELLGEYKPDLLIRGVVGHKHVAKVANDCDSNSGNEGWFTWVARSLGLWNAESTPNKKTVYQV